MFIIPHKGCYFTAHDRDTDMRFYRYSRTGSHEDDCRFRADVINKLEVHASQNNIAFGRQDREPFGQDWQVI